MKIHNAVHNDCSASLAKIESMPTSTLRTLWRELIGDSAATSLRRELLIPILAHKLQEKAYGGLRPSTRTHLRRLAISLAFFTWSIQHLAGELLPAGTDPVGHIWQPTAMNLRMTGLD